MKFLNRKCSFRIISCLLGVMFLAPSLKAAVYFVDFGSSSHRTLNVPDVWNNFTSNGAAAELSLVTSLGTSHGVKLASSGEFQVLNENPPLGAGYPDSAVRDAFFITGERTFTFSGLDPSLQYSLKVYGYVNRTDSRLTKVTVNGVSKTYEPGSTNAGNLTGGSVWFYNLAPNVSNELQFKTSTGTSTNYIVSLVELHVVPEPRVGGLVVLGMIGFVAVRRRPKIA